MARMGYSVLDKRVVTGIGLINHDESELPVIGSSLDVNRLVEENRLRIIEQNALLQAHAEKRVLSS